MRSDPRIKIFTEAILDVASPIIIGVAESGKSDMAAGQNMLNLLYGESDKNVKVKPAQLSPEEKLLVRFFYANTEIHNAIERLKDCETYISRFPFQKTRVTRPAYLRFIVEGQLHEIYLLKERLVSFVKLVKKAYRKDRSGQQIDAVTSALIKVIEQSFESAVSVRGSHVHKRRYDNSEIERLELIDLLKRANDPGFRKVIQGLKKSAVSDTHLRLKQHIREINNSASKVVGLCLDEIGTIIFTSDYKSFSRPSNYAKSKI